MTVVKRILRSFVIALSIFIVLYGCFYAFTTSRLSDKERETISTLYNRMRVVEPSIKSNFYVNVWLRVADKDYIHDQLRGDAITYSLKLTDNVLEMFENDRDIKYVTEYLGRNKLSFDSIVGLDTATSLYENLVAFTSMYVEDEEYLNMFATKTDEILKDERTELSKVGFYNKLYTLGVVLGFVIIYAFSFLFLDGKLKLKRGKKS